MFEFYSLMMETENKNRIQILGSARVTHQSILTDGALSFLTALHDRFHRERKERLKAREALQKRLEDGQRPHFLPETEMIRLKDWKVAEAPADVENRRVEITGPVEAKMMINALNSGANVFMADFEDSLSPTWENIIQGQRYLKDVVRKKLVYQSPEGKKYTLNDSTATLMVRPRGWHLVEKHVEIDGEPISASLFDFGLYFFHNAKERKAQGTGIYLYLPKLENHYEARLWREIFSFSENYLGFPKGFIRVTVLIETILAAFEMDEIMYELRDYLIGLNAGRWDYIFSIIKKFRSCPEFLLPDRSQVTMKVSFMKAYSRLLVKTAHRRGAHAIGGMSAFIPSRKDLSINEMALSQVKEDKEREANDGFDGTWVAHPDLVPVARTVFDLYLRNKMHQKDLQRDDSIGENDLLNVKIPNGSVTEQGIRNNIHVSLHYVERWLFGVGAVAIFNLMEDAATAEISRAQLWQWRKNKARLSDGRVFTDDLYLELRREEFKKLEAQGRSFHKAAELLDCLVLNEPFSEFLTLPAYDLLNQIDEV